MFTGIIEAIGTIVGLDRHGDDLRIEVQGLATDGINIGDSIAVNGVCLTAISLRADGFAADVSLESIDKTTFKFLKKGDRVNLEQAITVTTRLGGHLVSGHVDAVATIKERKADGRSVFFKITAPDDLAKYIAPKGSIAIDGVSLTVNEITGAEFAINIVPHTLNSTIMDNYHKGTKINLEVDLLARYLERLLLGDKAEDSGINEGFLRNNGFV